MISTIVATAEGGVIGKDNALPWYLPAELAHFKHLTMGHPIIMGRKTHESIGKALPGRTNIIVTRDKSYQVEGGVVVNSLQEALDQAKQSPGAKEIFVIGGQSIYEQASPLFDRIYLTEVHAKIDGDKFFKYDPAAWKTVSSEKHKADDKNQYDFEFLVLERKVA